MVVAYVFSSYWHSLSVEFMIETRSKEVETRIRAQEIARVGVEVLLFLIRAFGTFLENLSSLVKEEL